MTGDINEEKIKHMGDDRSVTDVIYTEPSEELVHGELQIFYQGQEVIIKPEDTPFVIGRDPASCQLHIDNNYISRQHCVILYRDNCFVLEDQSTNGSYVQFGRAHPIRVHQQSATLSGNGTIRLTKPNLDDFDLLLFRIKLS